MPRIEFKQLWTDDDGMVQLQITAASQTHRAVHDTYTTAERIHAFADSLRTFPQHPQAEVSFECGGRDATWRDYLGRRAFVLKPTGQSALEIELALHDAPPAAVQCHFYLAATPADLNRLGEELSRWLTAPTAALAVEWRTD